MKRNSAVSLLQALAWFLIGTLVLVLGVVALPVTLTLLFLRTQFNLEHPAIVGPHEILGVLLWAGMSQILLARELLKK